MRCTRVARAIAGVSAALVVAVAAAACQKYDRPADSETFAPCCGGAGTCIPKRFVERDVRHRLGVDECGADLLCVPSAFAEDAEYAPPHCRVLGRAEGRCLPSCVPAVMALAGWAQRDTCGAQELCVPCTDPRTGTATGACKLGGDPGPSDPPYVFAGCCGDQGRCVPDVLVDRVVGNVEQVRLGNRDCDAKDETCIATEWLMAERIDLDACRSVAGYEGRCVPSCVVELGSQAGLQPDHCREGELCAPCYDPRTGDDTGVCRQGGDQPREPVRQLEACCFTGEGGAAQGRCAPREYLATQTSAADLEQLGRDACSEGDMLCVPSEWLDDPTNEPTACRAGGGFEGRCLAACLPGTVRQADVLVQSSCSAGSLCAPCYDPTTGADTGACFQRGDSPKEAPGTFAPCCEGAGQCVARELVTALAGVAASADLDRLDRATCDGDALCVPRPWLQSRSARPASCTALGSFEGRCLSDCLPDVRAQAERLTPDGCGDAELCVPCFDPWTGADTGACRLAGDQPSMSARPVEACCESEDRARGRCLPRGALAGSALGASAGLERLDRDTCTQDDALCVPSEWIDQAEPSVPSCRAMQTYEGRCLPACLPDVRARAEQLRRDDCEAGNLCVPCFDPLTGESTGACSLGRDDPAGPPQSFAECCTRGAMGRGRCVPNSALQTFAGAADVSLLSRDSCADAGSSCVPNDFLGDGSFRPAMCQGLGNLEGRCMSECLPSVGANAARLSRAECSEGELCAPCTDPQSGSTTGVCTINGDRPSTESQGFETCCGTDGEAFGTCIPLELLPASQRELPTSSCAEYPARCVPTAQFEQPGTPFLGCRTLLGSPGVCIRECFIESVASTLSVGGCDSGERCVPCSLVTIPDTGCE